MLDGAIVLIGNAPLALARIARYALEEGVRPALVVGCPSDLSTWWSQRNSLPSATFPRSSEGRRRQRPRRHHASRRYGGA